jgi:hypothetical protein
MRSAVLTHLLFAQATDSLLIRSDFPLTPTSSISGVKNAVLPQMVAVLLTACPLRSIDFSLNGPQAMGTATSTEVGSKGLEFCAVAVMA